MGCKVLLPPGRRRCVQCRRGAKTGSNSINLRRGKKCSAAAAVCAMIYGGHRWRGQGTNLFIVRITFYYQVVRRGSPSPPQTLSGVSTLGQAVCQSTSRWDQVLSASPCYPLCWGQWHPVPVALAILTPLCLQLCLISNRILIAIREAFITKKHFIIDIRQ